MLAYTRVVWKLWYSNLVINSATPQPLNKPKKASSTHSRSKKTHSRSIFFSLYLFVAQSSTWYLKVYLRASWIFLRASWIFFPQAHPPKSPTPYFTNIFSVLLNFLLLLEYCMNLDNGGHTKCRICQHEWICFLGLTFCFLIYYYQRLLNNDNAIYETFTKLSFQYPGLGLCCLFIDYFIITSFVGWRLGAIIDSSFRISNICFYFIWKHHPVYR